MIRRSPQPLARTALVAVLGLLTLPGFARADDITLMGPADGESVGTTRPTFEWEVDASHLVEAELLTITYVGAERDLAGTTVRQIRPASSYVPPRRQQLFAGPWRWVVGGTREISGLTESQPSEVVVLPGVRRPIVHMTRTSGVVIGTIRTRTNTRRRDVRASMRVDGRPCRSWITTLVTQRAALHLWSTSRITCAASQHARVSLVASVTGLSETRIARTD